MYTTLISDCDGVLIDSEVVAFKVLVDETQSIFPHICVAEYMSAAFGQKTEELVRQLAEKAQAPIPEGFLQNLRRVTDETIQSCAQAVSDVAVLIKTPQLKAVASNSSTARVRAAAQLVGVFERDDVQIFSADEVSRPKPAPDLYQMVATRLAVPPEQCLVIEDSLSGVVAAQAAGMQVIGFIGGMHIPEGYEGDLRALGVLDVFRDMKNLPQVLQQIAGW